MILRKISIGTVQIFQYRYLSKYRYFWQHYPAPLSFWLICVKPFAKPSKLHFNHQCNDVSFYLTSTCLRRAMSRCCKFGLPRQTQLTLHNRAWIYGQGFTSYPSSSTSVEYDRVWFSAGSAPLTPVMSVCIFLVILAPVSSSAHYLLQLFPRSNFFFYSVTNVFSNVAKYNTSHKIYLSKITD